MGKSPGPPLPSGWLFGSVGSVPAWYSCRLVYPSSSKSSEASLGSLMLKLYWISHQSGIPSPSVSFVLSMAQNPFSQFLVSQSLLLRHFWSSWQEGQLPPQSLSDSRPLRTPSEQVGWAQVPK